MMLPTLIIISVISFFIISLPPGDFANTWAARLGYDVDEQQVVEMRARLGLDKPVYVQYWKWISRFVRGDFGISYEYMKPVGEVIGDRIFLTVVVSLSTLVFIYLVSIPLGIYSAIKQYSFGDYLLTFLGFLGLAIPNFSLALILMYFGYSWFGFNVGGLFSADFISASWSWARLLDLLTHLWVPLIVLGTAGTAGLIRVMRANLLDELHKPYVETARAKGVPKWKLLFKYPVRVALNPIVSQAAYILPALISGAAIVSVVLNLPTTGPVYLEALRATDMYLAGTFLMFLSILTIIGTLLSDILLVWLDPRIRIEGKAIEGG